MPQPWAASGLGDVAPRGTGADADAARGGIEDLDRVDPRDVEHDAAVVGRAPGDAVPTAADRQRHVLGASVRDRRGDLVRRRGQDHETGTRRPHVGRADVVVARVARRDGVELLRHAVVVDARCQRRGGVRRAGPAAGHAAAGARARRRRARAGALGGDELAHGRSDLRAEAAQDGRIVAREDEGGHAVLERERGQPLGLQHVGADVQQPAHGGGGAAGTLRGVVEDRVPLAEVGRPFQVRQRRQPAVGLAPGQAQHARLVGAEPDVDVVRGRRAAGGAVDAVVGALVRQGPPGLDVPDAADDVDRLRQRVDALARRQPPAAHRLDRVPEPAGTQAELEAPAAEQIQAGGGTGEHRGRPQREVEHVRAQADALGLPGHVAQQRPRVQEPRLVRVVLERRQVQAGGLGRLREGDHAGRLDVERRDERPEGQGMSVIGHGGYAL
jgi:hypothetical protein